MKKLIISGLTAGMLTACAAPELYGGGTNATGRFTEVYVKTAENVFLVADRAPDHLRRNAERWVDIQFVESRSAEIGSTQPVLNQSEADIHVGDLVEVQFTHRDNSGIFPVKELTRATKLAARKREMPANE